MNQTKMTTQDYINQKLAPYNNCDGWELIRKIGETAVDFHRALEAGRRDDRDRLEARYEELTKKLGFDPLA